MDKPHPPPPILPERKQTSSSFLLCGKSPTKRSIAKRRRRRDMNAFSGEDSASKLGGETEKDGAEVERKIAALQRLVPGGELLEVDKLFEETANYILALRNQVVAMKAQVRLFEGLQRQHHKAGA